MTISLVLLVILIITARPRLDYVIIHPMTETTRLYSH